MPDVKQIALSRMESGQSGVVVQVDGGQGMINRLGSMGVRPGQRITKVSAMFMRGPVTVQLGNAQLAIGYGMAKKIIVELG